MKLRIKKLHEDAKIPQRATSLDSGLDLYSIETVKIRPGQTKLIHTGIAVALPKPFELTIMPNEIQSNFRELVVLEGQVRCKSGLALKYELTVLNGVGTVDNKYRGEIGVIIKNTKQLCSHIRSRRNRDTYTVEKGQKIAQLVISPVFIPELVEVDILDDTDRGSGGYGSTGLK